MNNNGKEIKVYEDLQKGLTMFENAKIGDKVWHIRYGWMKILDIQRNDNYPIKVGFDGVIDTFTLEGKFMADDLNPTLFWDEIKIEIPPKPLPKLEVDTKVLVWDNNAPQRKFKRYFSHFDEDGKIVVFTNGTTSWSNNNNIWPYKNWELDDETKDSK